MVGNDRADRFLCLLYFKPIELSESDLIVDYHKELKIHDIAIPVSVTSSQQCLAIKTARLVQLRHPQISTSTSITWGMRPYPRVLFLGNRCPLIDVNDG